MSKSFKLTIALGNEAMRSPYDVAEQLRRAAARLDLVGDNGAQLVKGALFDDNGNRVGEWKVTR